MNALLRINILKRWVTQPHRGPVHPRGDSPYLIRFKNASMQR